MKNTTKLFIIAVMLCFLWGCSSGSNGQIAATTAPVWEFTSALCEGTPLTVTRLVTENVSCLHDYTLTVGQMKKVEQAELVILSGAGLEEFMEEILAYKNTVDASEGISLLEMGTHHHHEETEHDHDHHHEHDPHIWLSPVNAQIMAQNICNALMTHYPEHTEQFKANMAELSANFDALQAYGEATLSEVSCGHLITFHDGFGYLAEEYDLHILKAIEEESGSEASAQDLIELIGLIRDHRLPAVFTEINGSPAAADIICAETGAKAFALSMAMGDEGYFEAMYHNIDTLKEALQ